METFVHCKNNPQLTMISLSIDTSGLLLDQLSVIEKFLHHSAHRCDCFKQARSERIKPYLMEADVGPLILREPNVRQ